MQHIDQCNQRQADERGRVIALHGCHERNPQSFRFGTSGAIKGIFAVKIVFDFLVREFAKSHRCGNYPALNSICRCVQERNCTVEYKCLSAHLLELLEGAFPCARFTNGNAILIRDLVRSDHQRVLKFFLETLRLGNCQPQCGGGRSFTGDRRFVGIRAGRFKLETKSGEKLFPVLRCGTQDYFFLQNQ